MRQCNIIEGRESYRFKVYFSDELKLKINTIYIHNQDKPQALSQWNEYLEWIRKYMSTPSIAWNYANQHIEQPNGTYFAEAYGCNIIYSIETDANGIYVLIHQVNLKPQEFGLNEAKRLYQTITLTEAQFKKMLTECITKILKGIA